jgi:hypothetical protein
MAELGSGISSMSDLDPLPAADRGAVEAEPSERVRPTRSGSVMCCHVRAVAELEVDHRARLAPTERPRAAPRPFTR